MSTVMAEGRVEATGGDYHRLTLNPAEIEDLRILLDEIRSRWSSVEDEEFLGCSTLFAHRLPWRLREHLNDFRLREPNGICLISGWPVDQERIGPTPKHWREKTNPSRALDEEILLVLFASLLGDPIAWSTQQDGRLMHDVFPIEGHQGEQLGSGSEQLLWWHTEDAFHPYRGDYVGLMCLRNPQRAATTVLSASELELDPDTVEKLSREVFTIRPDESHLKKNNSTARTADPYLRRSYDRIEKMNTEPPKIGVLHGDPSHPYLRLDPYFMDPVEIDPEAWEAFQRLRAQIDQKMEDAVLEAGDFIFIDNFRAVHGRKPFKAFFDGTDRWLKRVNVVRDLRKSRDLRRGSDDRVIL